MEKEGENSFLRKFSDESKRDQKSLFNCINTHKVPCTGLCPAQVFRWTTPLKKILSPVQNKWTRVYVKSSVRTLTERFIHSKCVRAIPRHGFKQISIVSWINKSLISASESHQSWCSIPRAKPRSWTPGCVTWAACGSDLNEERLDFLIDRLILAAFYLLIAIVIFYSGESRWHSHTIRGSYSHNSHNSGPHFWKEIRAPISSLRGIISQCNSKEYSSILCLLHLWCLICYCTQ